MKLVFLVLTILLSCMLIGTASADEWWDHGTNVLTNPDFETWSSGNPTGWSIGTGSDATQTSICKNGSSAVLMTSATRFDPLMYRSSTVSMNEHDVTTVGYWVRYEDDLGDTVILRVYVGSIYTEHEFNVGAEWTPIFLSIAATQVETSVQTRIYSQNGLNNPLYIDDAFVIEGYAFSVVDHYGQDYEIGNREAMGESHINIGTMTVPVSTTLYLGDNTTLTIDAQKVVIDGTIDGTGAGSPGSSTAATIGLGEGYGAAGATGGGDTSAGGGSYGGQGGRGWTGSAYTGYGGGTYGSSTDKTVYTGSSGGTAERANQAGDGGGAITINTPWFVMGSTGGIYMNGSNGMDIVYPDGAAGGGSGGTILIVASSIYLPTGAVLDVSGGDGGDAQNNPGGYGGGGGAGGIVKRFYIYEYRAMTANTAGGAAGTGYGSGEAGASGLGSGVVDTSLITYDTEGYVYKSDGYTPVEGAVVEFDSGTYTDTTDVNGFWEISYIGASAIDYEITADYYQTKTGYVYISSTTGTTDANFDLNFEVTYLIYPQNDSTVESSFPPGMVDITFDWTDTSALAYKIEIAEDEEFSKIILTDVSSESEITKNLLVDDEYFWRIYQADDVDYSDPTEGSSFFLEGTSSLSGSAVEGIVYTGNVGEYLALSNAQVYISNASWSDSTITSSNGYYQFTGLTDTEVYSVYATKDLYITASSSQITIGTDPVQKNLYLEQDRTSQEWWHYCRFTLQNIWGTPYPDVDTWVYADDSLISTDDGITGADGAVVFHMDQNIEYMLVFENVSQGVYESFYLYPLATEYTVYVDSWSIKPGEIIDGSISAVVSSERISTTNGYINFTYDDTASATTAIEYWINDTEGNNVYHTSEGGPNMTNSQNVDADGTRYIVHFTSEHPTFGTTDRTQTIVFKADKLVSFGWPEDWMYAVTSIAILIFIGTFFGATTAHMGGLSIILTAWFLKWIGWFGDESVSTVLLLLATVVVVGLYLRKGEYQR